MRFHEALAKLAPTKGDGYMTRAGGPTVRNAVGPAEQAHHRYVVDAPEGVFPFDATRDDHAATDWIIGSRKADAEKAKGEAAKAEAEAKVKADAEKAKGAKKD